MGATASHPSLVAAEVALLQARAAAETLRSVTEAEAVRARAEVVRARDEAVSAASQRAFFSATAQAIVPLACGLAVAGLLAADFYMHESPAYIRHRMLATLRECRLPPTVSATAPTLLPVPQQPPVLSGKPLMLLGPTGCGKSTLLAGLARKALSAPHPAPTILVRLRLPTFLKDDQTRGPGEAMVLMDSAARQIYSQIGFPLRRSLLGALLSRGVTYQGSLSRAELDTLTPSGIRLISALGMLFSVCDQLFHERLAEKVPPQHAAPVLIFDELQDLIKDSRLKAAGGGLVFQMLAPLIVGHTLDREMPAVRIAVAGSSAELSEAFEKTVAKGNRWNRFTLKDPSPTAVLGKLEGLGYTSEEARGMVALCGTRLRLLSMPLTLGPSSCSAAAFLEECWEDGVSPIKRAFTLLDALSTPTFAALLDNIAAADAAGKDAPRPSYRDLPSAMQGPVDSSIFYSNRAGELFFQSQLQARAWEKLRARYSSPPGELR